jgi:mRNA-degrading endonuclease HigB of HigAB toxin-antitoxin module
LARFVASLAGHKAQSAVRAALNAAVDYSRRTVYIKWIGSHGEYDSIDAKTVQHED